MADSKSILHDLFKDMGQALIDGRRISDEAEAEFMEQARKNKPAEKSPTKPATSHQNKR